MVMSTATLSPPRNSRDSRISFKVRDVSGQRFATVRDCPADACIGEVVPNLLESMSLPRVDTDGNPLTHTLRRDSDGAMLNDGEIVGDVLQEGADVVLQPNIDAGAGGAWD
jgi:hypothetical protein